MKNKGFTIYFVVRFSKINKRNEKNYKRH